MIWKMATATGKILLFAIATLALAVGLALPLIFVDPSFMGFGDVEETLDFASPFVSVIMSLTLVAVIVTAGALLWLFDRRGLGAIGLRGERAASDIFIGVAFGAATLLVSVLAAWIVGVAQPNATLPAYGAFGMSVSVVSVLAAAAGEEVMFRGYILHELLSKFTARTAIFVSSILFALLHIDALLEDAMGVLGFVGLVLAGVLMALAVLKTGTLWLVIGIHAGWNFTLGPIFGWIVSGQEMSLESQLFTLQGPMFMTGGAFGFEGSVPGLLGTLLGIAILLPLPDRIPSAAPA